MPARATITSTVLSLIVIAACGSDDAANENEAETTSDGSQDAPGSTLAPTECLPGEGDTSTTIRITVDDPRDSFGSIASRVPSDLAAGTTRVELVSDEANSEPLDLPLLLDGKEVFRFVGVAPGTTCGVELELAAGDYRAVIGDSDVEFTIDE